MCCLLTFMHITTYASALLAFHCQSQSLKAVKTNARSHWASQSINNDDNDTDDDDFDEDDNDEDDEDDGEAGEDYADPQSRD